MALLAKAAERASARAEIRAAVDETMARFPYLAEFCAYMAAREGGDRLFFWQFIESEALSQWMALKSYANSLGIEIIGDLPIYVSEESSEVAYHKEWFLLDGAGRPSAVAGVPPDYFCPDGQLWGNPLYNYARMAEDGYAFWRERLSYMLTLFAGVRMDHFRALSAFWAVPAGAASAKEGGWIEPPGRKILDALRPITEGRLVIAEDLLGKFGDRLLVTHLNDNLGISRFSGETYWHDDLHLLPYDGIADWDDNIKRLRASKPLEILNFELNRFSKPNRFDNDIYQKLSLEEYYTEAYKRACRIAYRYAK